MIGVRMLLFVFSLLFLIPFPGMGDSLPQSVGPLTLEQFQSGEEARDEIDRLHGKPIDFQRGYIGTYGGGEGKAKLWVSEYASDGEALEAVEKMAGKVKAGKESGFWHFQEMPIEGVPVYFVLGMGQAHYFFRKGMKAIWLAVDPPVARQAIRDVIGEIP